MKAPCACTTVRKANRALFRFYEEALEGCTVSITQLSILRALERNGPTPLSDLAGELVMERTSLYRTIRPLESLKAVKIVNAKSGRAKIAALTKTGSQFIQEAEPFWNNAQKTVIGLIGSENFQALMQKITAIPKLLAQK